MKRRNVWSAPCAAFVLSALICAYAQAQVEKLDDQVMQSFRKMLPDAEKDAQGKLKKHLQSLSNAPSKAVANAVRVASDVKSSSAKNDDLVFYSVPAMSELQRLPDAYPLDGKVSAPVRIIAAGDEYEPGSFVVYPFSDLGKVKLTLSDFKASDGRVFPKGNLDLKVIKVWYQNGNGWYSYFGDVGLKLTPELLLNDEDIIKVDTKEVANYAREKTPSGYLYRWITPYLELDSRYDEHYRNYHTFSPMKKEFNDAETLQPVTLNAGEFKQFFLTAHVLKDTPAGIYKGDIQLSKDSKVIATVPVVLRVLPFNLPEPKSYFDTNKDYLTMSYNYTSFELIMNENGGNRELAEKQFLATMKNLKAHNQMFHWSRGGIGPELETEIRLLKEAGMRTDPFFGGINVMRGDNELKMPIHAKLMREYADKKLGHHNVFIGYGDEPGAGWLMQARPVFEAYQKEDMKFIIAGGDSVFYKAGYIYDFHNVAKVPDDGSSTKLWNQLNHAWVAWYAAQHVGPENPAFVRRQYGMAPYLNNYSATCNYAHHYGPYNDRSTTYKPMVFAYGVYDGVIDTLGWEGYREGVDDIRYATFLKRLCKQATDSKSLELNYAGRQALQFLACLDPASFDQDAGRLEMINHILKLQSLLQKNK